MLLGALTLVLQSIYVLCVVGLALYGGNALWLTWKYWQHRHRSISPQKSESPAHPVAPATQPNHDWLDVPGPLANGQWPMVTVQLPIYNEQHVVIRLLRACANLQYPRQKLQIQVLDDSDDDTREIIQREVANLRALGTGVEIVNRPTRQGYKAGALAHALATAQGEFIAIFDADFEPTEDFLWHTLPHFFDSDNQDAGFIQTRWDHLNATYSPLTQSQALALDGHFAIEQPARHYAGYFFGFNGSGGIWRRACIEDPAVGGWQADTLCEDLDLSYRAQLVGWRGIFLAHVTAPAEIPPQLLAYKRQQFRWAKGSIQTLRKLGPRVMQANLPMRIKVQAFMHLGGYWIHALLLLMLLVTLPIRILPFEPLVPLAWLGYTSLGPPLLYAVAQQRLRGTLWWQRWRYLPLLTLMGIGLSFNNTRAVFQGLFHNGGEFLRTPKFNVEKKSDQWNQSAYRLRVPMTIVAELFLMLYAIAICLVLIQQRDWWSLPFILIYAAGFGFMAGTGIWQARTHHQPSGPAPTGAEITDKEITGIGGTVPDIAGPDINGSNGSHFPKHRPTRRVTRHHV